MFKDQFTLNKNAWYSKMMNYIWGLKPRDFSHICPFFWLSILNILIFIPFASIKSFLQVIGWCIERFSKFLTNISERLDEKKEVKRKQVVQDLKENNNLLEDFLHKLVDSQNGGAKLSSEYKDAWSDIIYRDRDYDFERKVYEAKRRIEAEKMRMARLREENERIQEEYEKKQAIKRKERINKLVKMVKPIGQGILILLSAGVVFGIGWLVYHLCIAVSEIRISTQAWTNLLKALKFVGIGLVVVAIGAAIIYSLFRLIDMLLKNYTMSYKTKVRISKFFSHFEKIAYIALPFIWFFKGAGKIISIIGQMIKNNCPAIKWEDK